MALAMHLYRTIPRHIKPIRHNTLPVQQQIRTTHNKESPLQPKSSSMVQRACEFFKTPAFDHQEALVRLQAHPKTLPEKEALAALKKDIDLITPLFILEAQRNGYTDFDKGTYNNRGGFSRSPNSYIQEGNNYSLTSELETLLRFQGWKVLHVQHNYSTFDSERLWFTDMLKNVVLIPTQENRLLMVDADFPRNFKKAQDPPLLVYTQAELKEKLANLTGRDLEFYANLSTDMATEYNWPNIDLGKYNPSLGLRNKF